MPLVPIGESSVVGAVVDNCAVLGDFFRNPVALPGSTTREGAAPPYLLTSTVRGSRLRTGV